MTIISFLCGQRRIQVPEEYVAFLFPSIVDTNTFFVTLKSGKQYRATELVERIDLSSECIHGAYQ